MIHKKCSSDFFIYNKCHLRYILWSNATTFKSLFRRKCQYKGIVECKYGVCVYLTAFLLLLKLVLLLVVLLFVIGHRVGRLVVVSVVRGWGVARTVQAWELNGADLFRARGTSHAPGMLRPPLLRRAAIGWQEALRHLCAALLLAPHSTMPWDWLLALIMRQLSMSLEGEKQSYFKSSHFKSHFRVAAVMSFFWSTTVNLNRIKCLLSVFVEADFADTIPSWQQCVL